MLQLRLRCLTADPLHTLQIFTGETADPLHTLQIFTGEKESFSNIKDKDLKCKDFFFSNVISPI